MSISSISPSSSSAAAVSIQKPESMEKPGSDHDSDADNRVSATSTPPKPVVNTSGQTTGLVVNTKA